MFEKICIIMVGLPGLGKSTLARKIQKERDVPDASIISTDGYIERKAEELGKTYNEVFSDTIDEATKHFDWAVNHCLRHGFNMILDQTNLTRNKREKIIRRMQNEGYEVHCVFIHKPDPISAEYRVWQERLSNRPGKTIPEDVMEQMQLSIVPPTLDEGFNKITIYDLDGDKIVTEETSEW